MKKYRLSVCKGPDCRRNGSDKVYAAFKDELGKSGLASRCELYRGGCYGLCHLGPNVVVRVDTGRRDALSPEDFQLMGWEGEVHYDGMTADRAERIVREHVGEDRPVEEWRSTGSDVPPVENPLRLGTK